MLPIKRWRRCRKWNATAQRIREVPRRRVVPGCQFAVALSLRYSVRTSKRALLASVIASKRHCALSISNTLALSHRPVIGLNNQRRPGSHPALCYTLSSKRGQSANRATLRSRATLRRYSISNEEAHINSYALSQDPADAQWPRNGRIAILEHEKVKLLSLVGRTSPTG
jgi:hypothetical protein